MPEIDAANLRGVSETLFVTLGYRAYESRRPDALLRDDRAVELADRVNYDFRRLGNQAFEQLVVAMRAREFDRYTRAFMAEHRDAVIVDIGCGLIRVLTGWMMAA